MHVFFSKPQRVSSVVTVLFLAVVVTGFGSAKGDFWLNFSGQNGFTFHEILLRGRVIYRLRERIGIREGRESNVA